MKSVFKSMHCSHKNRGIDITWWTYNSTGSTRLNWTCVRVVTTWLNSYYIISITKSAITSCITTPTTGSKLDHIISIITATTTSHNKITVTRGENNLSTNNYIIINRDIIKTTTNFVCSKESDSVSIWGTWELDYSIDRTNFSTYKLDFWITRSKTWTHLAFLTHF